MDLFDWKLNPDLRFGLRSFFSLLNEDTPVDLTPKTPSMANTQVEAANRETNMIFFMFLSFNLELMVFRMLQI
jgi:hypothetical protein